MKKRLINQYKERDCFSVKDEEEKHNDKKKKKKSKKEKKINVGDKSKEKQVTDVA